MTETDARESRQRNDRNGNQQRCISDCSIRALEGEGNERRFALSFSSEEPYERWFGKEILSHDEGAADLSRLNSIGVVLYNHDRDRVIGKILSAGVKDGRGVANIEFDRDPESETIYQKVLNGTLRGVSVGYRVNEWEEVPQNKSSSDGRFAGPCCVARHWEPFEVSIVSVPADATVGVGRSQEDETKKGVSSFYYCEKQLQINKNLSEGGKRP